MIIMIIIIMNIVLRFGVTGTVSAAMTMNSARVRLMAFVTQPLLCILYFVLFIIIIIIILHFT